MMKYLALTLALSFSVSAQAERLMADCYKDSMELKISQTGRERAEAKIYFEGVEMISEEGRYQYPSDTMVFQFFSDKKSGVRYAIYVSAELHNNNDDDNGAYINYVSPHTGRQVKRSLMCK